MTTPFVPLVSRRDMLRRTAMGFGSIGLAGTMQAAGLLSQAAAATTGAAIRTHFAPRAKRVIYLFMNGGPSHVDTFDPKPVLKDHEGEIPESNGRKKKGGFVPSPFAFAPQGESGVVMSELFPNLATRADDLCVIRSMHTDVPNHEPGLLLMHSGNQQPIRPSMGSWVSYGLGTENENLPAFVVLAPRRPVIGPFLWSNSFLPGAHQGMSVDTNDLAVDKLVMNLHHPSLARAQQRQNRIHRRLRP
jgi:hypothetical protein